VRTVVLRSLSSRLTPVMTRYALVAKELMSCCILRRINLCLSFWCYVFFLGRIKICDVFCREMYVCLYLKTVP